MKGVEFAFGSCSWDLLICSPNRYWCKWRRPSFGWKKNPKTPPKKPVGKTEETLIHELRGFTTKDKPLVSFKNWNARLDLSQKTSKKSLKFWNKSLWTDETKMNLYQTDEKTMERERNGSWMKAYYIICQTMWGQCYGIGMYGKPLN